MKSLLNIFLVLVSINTLNGQKAGLTFFSQEGELFYVILDGIRQNNIASANVKITDLDRPNYRAKIIFDNAELKDINKNLFVHDVDDKAYHAVYMIVKNKKGEMDLKLSSFNEVKETAVAAKENAVKYHDYEIPQETKTTTKTTQTTVNSAQNGETVNINMNGTGANVKVNQGGESVSIGINLDGMKDMMNVTDGSSNTQMTTTTTTTSTTTRTTSQSKTLDNPYQEPTAAPTNKGCVLAMSSSDFEKGKTAVSKQSFAESMMKSAKQMTKANCMNIKQIRAIMDLFSFEESKLEYAKFAYEYCVDKKNYFQLTEAFSFSSSSDSLNEFIDAQQ